MENKSTSKIIQASAGTPQNKVTKNKDTAGRKK